MDVKTFNPRGLLYKLHGSSAQLEAVIQRQRYQQADDSANQGDPADSTGMFIPTHRQQQNTKNDWRPDCKTQQTHFVLFLI